MVRGDLINYVPLQMQGRIPPSLSRLRQSTSVRVDESRNATSNSTWTSPITSPRGREDKADVIKTFYDEYFAVMDCADFFTSRPRATCFRSICCRQGKTVASRPAGEPGLQSSAWA